MSHQMELEFAKVCYADNPDMEPGVVFNLGELALTASQPKASGAMQRFIERGGTRGVTVAPLGNSN